MNYEQKGEQMIAETNCTIEVQGKSFTAGGAVLLPCSDGRWRGAVYVNEKENTVQTWHGEKIAPAKWTNYRGNFCRMRRVSFVYDGRKFVGDYCPDWADLCRVRSTK